MACFHARFSLSGALVSLSNNDARFRGHSCDPRWDSRFSAFACGGRGVAGELGYSRRSLWVGLALGMPTLALLSFPWCGHFHETLSDHGSFGEI